MAVVKSFTPKQRFQQEAKVRVAHRQLVELHEFELACDFALLQLQHELTEAVNGNTNLAAAAHMKLAGAQDFIRVFRNLAETPGRPKGGEDRDNLNQNA
jgi:hypothetical protein